MSLTCCAIIVAAGNSTRMNRKGSKQMIPLLGKPVLVYTLQAFQQAKQIDKIVVVCRSEEKEQIQNLLETYQIEKVVALSEGGKTRQESVQCGLRAAGKADYYAIHDGARPLILPTEIDKVILDAHHWKASFLGSAVKDTIKQIQQDKTVRATLDRDFLCAVETPQVFEAELYKKALEKACEEGKNYTDDCQLIEQMGVPVHWCKSEFANLKITVQDDVFIAESILKSRGEGI